MSSGPLTVEGSIESESESEQTAVDAATESCPECGGALDHDAGPAEVSCTDCGLVVEDDRVDRGPEWRSFEDDGSSGSRVGAPVTRRFHDRGLSTDIDWRDSDANGNPLGARQRRKLRRLRKWNKRFQAQSATDRNLKHALGEVERMASSLGLPGAIREVASTIYRRALEEDLIKGHSIEAMASAALYGAARQQGTPRSLDEFANVSRVERTKIQRAYRRIARQLGLEIEPADPRSYVRRYVSELDLDQEVERTATDLIDAAVETNFHSGKSPVSLAAAAVYAAARLANDGRTQQAVADVANVSKITIRARYKQLLERYDGPATV